MSLSVNQPAPDFSTTDVYGHPIHLSKLQGKKVYLAFERNAGCPICNLRTHELLKHADRFAANNILVIMVYQSPVSSMRDYLGANRYPFHFVADPENNLYNSYGVRPSALKLFRGMLHGLLGKVIKGYKLFTKFRMQDANLFTIPAEFVVNEAGNLSLVHYGRYLGDHLPVEKLLAGLND